MRHRIKGRKLGRNPSHRKAMLRNMARSLILSVAAEEGVEGAPKVPGRITTTVPKAKELRPLVEQLITLGKKALESSRAAADLKTDADRGTDAYEQWRKGDGWQKWNQAAAPALNYRRKAFSILRDNEAVDILFDDLAERFEDRPGGYTRIVRLATRRLGDSGEQAMIEFVGQNDRVRVAAAPAPMVVGDESAAEPNDTTADDTTADDTTADAAPADESTPEDAPETQAESTAPEAENANEVKDD